METETAARAGSEAVGIRDEEGVLSTPISSSASPAPSRAMTAATLRALVGDLHEADLGDVLQALDPDERDQLVRLMGNDFDWVALTEVDDTVRSEILENDPERADRRGRPRARFRRRRRDHRRPRRGGPRGGSGRPAARRAHRAGAPARLPGGIRRPADDDAFHRRAAVLDGRTDDRLHARGFASARRVHRALRRRSELPLPRHGAARPAAPLQAPDQDRGDHRRGEAFGARRPTTRRTWRASSSATTFSRSAWSTRRAAWSA